MNLLKFLFVERLLDCSIFDTLALGVICGARFCGMISFPQMLAAVGAACVLSVVIGRVIFNSENQNEHQ